MGHRVPEGAVEFVLCCPAMRRAVGVDPRDEAPDSPRLGAWAPVTVLCAGASIQRDPLRFCPWCGREILPRDRRVAILWELRRRLAASEAGVAGLGDEDALNASLGEQARLREEILALESEGRRPSA
jgi:hypothetical protein